MSQKINFTKVIISTSRPSKPGQRLVLLDNKTPGLQCRITYSGVATFSIYKRLKNGQVERITLGRFPDMTIEQARMNAAKINACIATGGNPGEIKRAHKSELTFEELYDKYMDEYAKLRKRSWRGDECRYRLYLKTSLGKKKLSQITRSHIAQIHLTISKQPKKKNNEGDEQTLKRITANRVLGLISSMFGWAIKAELYHQNPAINVTMNPEKSRDRFLQPEELSKFFAAVKSESPTIRDYILLSLYTGARRSNVVSMRWDQISFHHRTWLIPDTKNGEPIVIPLIDDAIELLKTRMNNRSEFVFPSESKQGHVIDPRRGWLRILKRSGLKDLRIHDLRRTLGSWQAIMGSSTIIIGKSLGHKSQDATAIYARLNIDPVRKSLEKATAAMFEAAMITQPK